jgi:uncharacterized protein YodC (DUF2158 family)
METNFIIGDIVRLISGGPRLVVTEDRVGYTRDIRVAWIDEGGARELTLPSACFAKEELNG